jgi:hypothetical protein
MRRLLRFAGRTLFAVVVTAVFGSLCLLLLWQVVVIGVAAGPAAVLVVAAIGLAGGFAALAVHEVGHFVAGRLAGLPPRSLTVAFLRAEWPGGWLRLRLNTVWFRPAGVAWHEVLGATRRQVAVMVAGGPAASLAAGAGCLAWAAEINPGPTDVPVARQSGWRDVALVWPGSSGVAALNVTGLVSLYLGAGTLVPGRAAGLRTDGGQLLDLALGRWTPSHPKQTGGDRMGPAPGPPEATDDHAG